MQSSGVRQVGLNNSSVWSYSPHVKRYRPNVKTAVAFLEDVKYTSADLIQMSFDNSIPNYTHSAITPRVLDVPSVQYFNKTDIPELSARFPSMTSYMMNKAMALKAYSIR